MSEPGPYLEIAHNKLRKSGTKSPPRIRRLPPWHGWKERDTARRARRWIESRVLVPTGHNAGELFKLAPYEWEWLKAIYDNRATFVSVPTGNGKTTFMAAVALERICRGDDYAEVDLLATREEQAKVIVETAKRIVELSPELVELCAYYAGRDAGILEYALTGSRMGAFPATLNAVQGLNFSLAIVDEFGFAKDAVVESLIARLGKRPDATLVGVGTPGFEPNVMFRMRERAQRGELPYGVHYIEHAAEPGCALNDQAQWRDANPAIRAGFLSLDALAVQAVLLDETTFRVYHLGQWVDGAHGWLPPGAWEACPYVPAPPPDTEVVLALEGTYKRTTAIVGATLDGTIFHGWAAEVATDDELRAMLEDALSTWRVVEIVVAPRIRPHLVAALEADGLPIERWRTTDDVTAADELFRAVVERRVAHDHAELLAEQMATVVIRRMSDSSIRLARPEDGAWVDAALAARMAWWRAAEMARRPPELAAPSIW